MFALVPKLLTLAAFLAATPAVAGKKKSTDKEVGPCEKPFSAATIVYQGPIKNYAGPAERQEATIGNRRTTGARLLDGRALDILFPKALPNHANAYPYDDLRTQWRFLRKLGYDIGALSTSGLLERSDKGRKYTTTTDFQNKRIYFNPFQIDEDPNLLFLHAVVGAAMYHRVLDAGNSRTVARLDWLIPQDTHLYLREKFGLLGDPRDKIRDEEESDQSTFRSYEELQAALVGRVVADLASWQAYKAWRDEAIAPEIRKTDYEALVNINESFFIDVIASKGLELHFGLEKEHALAFAKAVRDSGIIMVMGFTRLSFHPSALFDDPSDTP